MCLCIHICICCLLPMPPGATVMSAADVLSNVYELACLAAAKQPQGHLKPQGNRQGTMITL